MTDSVGAGVAATLPEAALYDAAAARQRGVADVPVYRALALVVGEPVLELGAGTGRVLGPLVAAGVDATGLELDPARISAGRARLDGLYGAGDRLVEGDLRTWRSPRPMRLIIAPYNVFNLLDDRDVDAALAAARANLAPDGELAFEVQCWPDPTDPRSRWELGPTPLTVRGQPATVREEVERRGPTRIRVARHFEFTDGSSASVAVELRCRTLHDWLDLLAANRWALVTEPMDEHGRDHEPGSRLAIVRARPS